MFNSIFAALFHATLQICHCSKSSQDHFQEISTVVGWLPWETDADMETPCGGGFLGVILETDLLRGAGSCTPQRKLELQCCSTDTSVTGQGRLELRWPLRGVLTQSWVSVSLNQPVSRGGLPCGGSKNLGQAACMQQRVMPGKGLSCDPQGPKDSGNWKYSGPDRAFRLLPYPHTAHAVVSPTNEQSRGGIYMNTGHAYHDIQCQVHT